MNNNNKISMLESKSNSFEQLENFFNSNKQIQQYFDEIKNECIKNNYYGKATMMILTIEQLLEKIEDLEDEINFLEKEKTLFK